MQLTVDKIIQETEEAVSVVFKKPGFFKRVKYKAGQFLTVQIPINGIVENRAYSFSSSPEIDNFLRITVKKVEKGRVSNYICNELKEGQKVKVKQPAGSFFVTPNKSASDFYVFFGAGSGITPLYAITQTVLAQEPKSKVLLIYSNRNEESIIFHEAFKVLAKKYPERFYIEHILEKKTNTAPNYNQDLLQESLVTQIFEKYQLSFEDKKYMMCGPQGYMDVAKGILNTKGITRSQIKLEAFSLPLVRSSDATGISNVTILHNGNTHELEVPGNKTILQAAMEKNILLPYSCRSGMCSSCLASCNKGEVKMVDGHLLSDEEVDQGNVLVCVCFPVSEHVEIVY